LLIACGKPAEIAPAPNTLWNGLEAYYPFNGNALDVSVNKRHAVLANGTFAPGQFGNSFVFTPLQSGAVEAPIGLLKQVCTISFWVNKSDPSKPTLLWTNQFVRDEKIAGTMTTSTYGFRLGSNAGDAYYTLALQLGVLSNFYVNIPYMPNVWEFYVLQFTQTQGFTLGADVTVYKNGVLFLKQPMAPIFLNALESSATNRLGGGEGKLDEVGVWTRALTSDEIVQLYKKGL
jgi:hypothetical protein